MRSVACLWPLQPNSSCSHASPPLDMLSQKHYQREAAEQLAAARRRHGGDAAAVQREGRRLEAAREAAVRGELSLFVEQVSGGAAAAGGAGGCMCSVGRLCKGAELLARRARWVHHAQVALSCHVLPPWADPPHLPTPPNRRCPAWPRC